jgi:hypothetical protein
MEFGGFWFCVGGKIKKKVREAFQADKLPFRASGKFQFSFLSFDDVVRRVLQSAVILEAKLPQLIFYELFNCVLG